MSKARWRHRWHVATHAPRRPKKLQEAREEDSEGAAWDVAAAVLLGKRRGPSHPGHCRPIATTDNLKKVWAYVFLAAATPEQVC